MMAAASPCLAIQAAIGDVLGLFSWRAIAGAITAVSAGSIAQCGPRSLANRSPTPTRKAVTSSGPIGSCSVGSAPAAGSS